MMCLRGIILFYFFTLFSFGSRAQVPSQVLEERAVRISDRAAANDTVYQTIKNYRAILVGSIHGTKESTEFLFGIVNTLTKNGKKVIVGLELPADAIDVAAPYTNENLKQSTAFNSLTRDGRQSLAWAELITGLQKINVDFFCFDLPWKMKGDVRVHRDSIMYTIINEELKRDTNRVLVTLTGNLVNWLTPYKKQKTLGWYLQHETGSVLKDKNILSLNHLYMDGEAYYWKNNGYKLWPVEGNAGFFGYAAPYDNYLFIYPVDDGHNGIIYSKTLTASPALLDVK